MKKKLKLSEQNEPKIFTPDTSPIIPQRSKIKFDLHISEKFKFTEKQQEFINLVMDKKSKLIFVNGPAGTSKSYISILVGLKLLTQKRVSDIVYVRSIVESADQKIGFLPGEIDSKIQPYLEPLFDKLSELLPKNEIDLLKRDNRVNAIPVSFLRGHHWNCKYIFCDESQNLTLRELTTIITRVGEYSRIVIAGDSEQNDCNGRSGFIKMMGMFDDQESRDNGIFTFKFTEEDIVRSGLVRFIVKKLRQPS